MQPRLIPFPRLVDGNLDMECFWLFSAQEQKLAIAWLALNGTAAENRQFRILRSQYRKIRKIRKIPVEERKQPEGMSEFLATSLLENALYNGRWGILSSSIILLIHRFYYFLKYRRQISK